MRSHIVLALVGLSSLLVSASPHGGHERLHRRAGDSIEPAVERISSVIAESISATPLSTAVEVETESTATELFLSQTIESTVPNATADVDDDVAKALKAVQEAQLQMARNNTYRMANIRRNNYYFKPNVEQDHAVARVKSDGTKIAPPAVAPPVAAVAAVVAEYLPAENSTSPVPKIEARQNGGSFWMEQISHANAYVTFAPSPNYKAYRNVRDYGAKGDGKTDDTAAINKAISDGNRCGESCGSTTVAPAIIYFPAGTYLISSPIISYYNSQLIGNANNRPIIKASKSFVGLGAISSDVYIEGANGAQWYINQNNFLRQVRNFVLDITDVPNTMVDPKTHQGLDMKPCAIHWQVAQATSLQNIKMIMSKAKDSTHVGIFMENGSGGWIGDLEFEGGDMGAIFGNQQFTMRSLKFRNCKTAVHMLWDWGFTLSNFDIQDCGTGFEITGGGGGKDGKEGQGIGGLMLIDSYMKNCAVGILGTFAAASTQLVLENIKLENVAIAVKGDNGGTFLPGGTKTIESFVSGKVYSDPLSKDGKYNVRSSMQPPPKPPASLRGKNGWFARSKPQYENVPASQFWNVKARSGCQGNGRTDDTAALNKAIADATAANMIVYIPFGMYIVTDTIVVPKGARIVGELWAQIMASGPIFSNIKKPRVVVKVGNENDVGSVEIQDLMVTVRGGTAGAILMQWNIRQDKQGSAAMWDVHFRIGGAIGSNLQAKDCPKLTGKIDKKCICGSMLLHMTPTSSGYFENFWAWTADHDLDIFAETQIDIYVGRGMLIESQGPVWMWGSASEHNVLYQYQLDGAKDIWLGMIQTESPYFQGITEGSGRGYTDELAPFDSSRGATWENDPSFVWCKNRHECLMSWGVRILGSQSIWLYGGGIYSWFQKYNQACLKTESCQDAIIDLDDRTSKDIWLYNIATKGVKQMVTPWVGFPAMAMDNKNGYTATIMGYMTSSQKYISQWVNFGALTGAKI